MRTRIQRILELWGAAEEVSADPAIEVLDDGVYIPRSGSTPHTVVANGSAEALNAGPVADLPGIGPDPAGATTYFLVEGLVEHYGHFIVDCMSRLWPLVGWSETSVKLVCEPQNGRQFWERHTFLCEILAGLGLALDDIVTFDRPVVLPRAVLAEPSFRSRECVHVIFGDLCRRIGGRYWSDAEVDCVARPAYLAKLRLTTGMQHLANEADLVAELERLGVDILFPEEMTFAEQVREFARRRVLMGPVGSAFHTSAFSAPGRRLIGLTGSPQLNSNYVLFDKVSNCFSAYYFVPGTEYRDKQGFGFSWLIVDPHLVAAQMVARAEHFDRIELYDQEIEQEEARKARTLAARLRRIKHAAAARWGRLLRDQRRSDDAY